MFVMDEARTRFRQRSAWGLMAVLLLACGCARTATVSGKVTYKGRTVTYGSVIMVSADKTARSTFIEADGSYTVQDVHPGQVQIAVISPDPSKARALVQRGDSGLRGKPAVQAAAKRWFGIPRQFQDPQTSGLTCTIAGGRVQHDIDLN